MYGRENVEDYMRDRMVACVHTYVFVWLLEASPQLPKESSKWLAADSHRPARRQEADKNYSDMRELSRTTFLSLSLFSLSFFLSIPWWAKSYRTNARRGRQIVERAFAAAAVLQYSVKSES